MRKLEILPGVIVDETMFEDAAAGVARFAPQLPALTWERYTEASLWWNIPGDKGKLSKTETTLFRSKEFTARLNIWHAEDERGGDKPLPHNHPWNRFTGHLLGDDSGYTEDRYLVDADGNVSEYLGIEHLAPELNVVDHPVFHEVRYVHNPGRTQSLMTCDDWTRNNWWHLNVETGEKITGQPVPQFEKWFRAANPHQSFA